MINQDVTHSCSSQGLESNVDLDRDELENDTQLRHIITRKDLSRTTHGSESKWSKNMVSRSFGIAEQKQSDEALQSNTKSLARMLLLLRNYESRFGIPDRGGPKDQQLVLKAINKELYAGGTPLWALASVMTKAAEGLTGEVTFNFWLLPRKTLIFNPSLGGTAMYSTSRGFCLYKIDKMEPLVIRLASFASNTSTVTSLPARFPHPEEFRKAESSASATFDSAPLLERGDLAGEILNLASKAEGLFSYITAQAKAVADDRIQVPADQFWKVDASTREIFSRLATMEAMTSIEKVDAETKVTYPEVAKLLFRMASSSGACAVWFNGSWVDVLLSGFLGVLVGFIKSSSVFTLQERLLVEVVASFCVGIAAGLISLQWPDSTCFGAMALSGVLDILHGFRIVFAIIEIMSKQTISGGADFLEGILFTGLISFFLEFGQYIAASIMGDAGLTADELDCSHEISEWWYLLLVPVAAISWSGLFNPRFEDLPVMGFHGVLGFAVSWAISRTSVSAGSLNNFIAALAVSLSAGIISRLSGRQAIGNTVAGIFGLVPGAYLVRGLYSSESSFLGSTILRCIVIGIGAWTGTLFCSPSLLGAPLALLSRSRSAQQAGIGGDGIKKNDSMLFF